MTKPSHKYCYYCITISIKYRNLKTNKTMCASIFSHNPDILILSVNLYIYIYIYNLYTVILLTENCLSLIRPIGKNRHKILESVYMTDIYCEKEKKVLCCFHIIYCDWNAEQYNSVLIFLTSNPWVMHDNERSADRMQWPFAKWLTFYQDPDNKNTVQLFGYPPLAPHPPAPFHSAQS